MESDKKITDEEKARRKSAIDFARGSSRFEGIIMDEEVERINQRYINGEFSLDGHRAALLEYLDRRK